MTGATRIGIAFQTDKHLADYGPLAERAEALGFESVTVYDDLMFQPPWLPLSEIARATQRVLVGPAAVNPFVCHPVHLAAQAALIEEAAPGRTYLGISRGSWLDLLGIRPRRTITAMREALQLIRQLLSGEAVVFEGEIFRMNSAEGFQWPIPEREIPLLLGSWGPRTIRTCAPLVKEVKVGGTANPDAVRRVRSWLDSTPGGRSVGLVVGCVSVVDEDAGRARQLARRKVTRYLTVIGNLDPELTVDPELPRRIEALLRQYDEDSAARLVPDNLLGKFALAGSPVEVIEHCQALAEAGADRIEFGTPHGWDERQGIELLGRRVLPALQSRLGGRGSCGSLGR